MHNKPLSQWSFILERQQCIKKTFVHICGYLLYRLIWLCLSQKVALLVGCFCFSQCGNMFFAACNFPKINSLFPPTTTTPAAFLSPLHIPKSPFHGGLYLHPSWVLIPLCSLLALLFSSTWPPWQCAGGLIELCLCVRFGMEAAHLPAFTGQLSPPLLGWKDRVLQITFQSERERLRRWGKGCSLRSHRHYLFLLLSISHVLCPYHSPSSSNFFPDLYFSSSHSQ